MEHALSPLAAWESFYVIVGSSAAALTGLQFVVIVLGAEMHVLGSGASARAFGTPTIVHFCAVLLISAVLSAPWPALSWAGVCFGLCAVVGVTYVVRAMRHARRQTDYVPVLEDWLFHGALPILAYVALLPAALALTRHPAPALFAIGGTALLLLFVGIHNAWDAVTYIAFDQKPAERAPEPGPGKTERPKPHRKRG